MDGQSVAHPYNWLLFSQEKQCRADTQHNVDEPHKYYTESKRATNKDHTLYDCTSMQCPEQGDLQTQKVD